jgi:hypothetical protein
MGGDSVAGVRWLRFFFLLILRVARTLLSTVAAAGWYGLAKAMPPAKRKVTVRVTGFMMASFCSCLWLGS